MAAAPLGPSRPLFSLLGGGRAAWGCRRHGRRSKEHRAEGVWGVWPTRWAVRCPALGSPCWGRGGAGPAVGIGDAGFRGSGLARVGKAVFPTQNGKVAIVTGGAKGIGYQTVKHLARLGMHVIIAGNSEREGQEAVRKIQEETLTGKVEFLYCDLASMKSIRQFVQRFRAKNCPLHVLVNNAGVMLVPERKTEDGFEEHFGLNYLGHFLLTNLLLDTLKQSGTHSHNARIITVSSATHYVGKLHLDDLQSRRSYSPHGAYAQSKLALVLFTYRLQHLLTADGSHVTANVVDPGVVNTDLYKHVFWVVKVAKWMTAWLFFKTPEEGASTSIYAAVSPEMEGAGGCYLYNEERTKSADIAYDEELQRRLWTESCKMTGISDESRRVP